MGSSLTDERSCIPSGDDRATDRDQRAPPGRCPVICLACLQASIQSLRRRQHQLEGMREGAPPEYGKMALAPGGFAMNNRFIVAAAFLLLLFQLNHGDAASPGPYDGEWTGQATSAGERCKRAVVNFTIEGRVVREAFRSSGDSSAGTSSRGRSSSPIANGIRFSDAPAPQTGTTLRAGQEAGDGSRAAMEVRFSEVERLSLCQFVGTFGLRPQVEARATTQNAP
jgi:hypothetical protein